MEESREVEGKMCEEKWRPKMGQKEAETRWRQRPQPLVVGTVQVNTKFGRWV